MAKVGDIARGGGRFCSSRCYRIAVGQQPLESRLWAKVNKDGPIPPHRPELGPCWMWTGLTNSYGYGQIGYHGKGTSTHRLVWTLANGPIPDGLHVLHHCDNPPCVRLGHLFVGTPGDNMRDMTAKGRQARGEVAHSARLTATQVIAIRARYAAGESQHKLAGEYGISQSSISALVLKRKWAHV